MFGIEISDTVVTKIKLKNTFMTRFLDMDNPPGSVMRESRNNPLDLDHAISVPEDREDVLKL